MAAAGNQAQGLWQAGQARQVQATTRRLGVGVRGDLLTQRGFLGGAEQHHSHVQQRGQFGKVDRWPAFGRPKLSPRGKHHISAAPQPSVTQRAFHQGGCNRQLGMAEGLRVFAAQRRIKRHHRRLVFGIFEPVRQQPHTAFAKVADALGNTCQKWQQRAFQRVGQHISRVELPGQLLGDHPACPELQAAVGERELNHFFHLRHRTVNWRDPGQRTHRQLFAARRQPAHQGFCHHRVANPLRRHDERSTQHTR